MKAYPKKTRFAVWGYGLTGQALAEVLHDRGYVVTVVEDKPESAFQEKAEQIANLKTGGVVFNLGGMPNLAEFVGKQIDVLSPSPGIDVPAALKAACAAARVQIAGEVEIAHRLVQGKTIAVTGTDGKTTTVSLIHHILTSSGVTSHLAGNVGLPIIKLAGKTKADHWLVIEVSSYQLETVRLFRPQTAVLLNIAEDHLARHGDMRTYIRMKGRIFEKQRKEDHALLNFDDPACLQAYGQASATIHGFSLAGPIRDGAWRQENALYLYAADGPKKVVGIDEISLPGEHNLYNVLASILACSLAECPIDAIGEACRTFKSLPHRIEPVAEIDGVLWVNDSKATNIHSAISAIKVFKRPIVLLLGGSDKGLDLTDLIPHIQRQVRHVVLLGETRGRFRKALREVNYTDITVRKTLAEACAAADSIAKPGDVVLLSPGSSSFDQFKDFVERGEAFRKWVERRASKRDR
jgi:UDP-N-acetylmuramoylalanine--D-glutamate ligase